MKILQVIPNFGFGGAETMCEALTYELQKNNEVCVISLYDDKTEIAKRMLKNGVNILFLGKKSGLDFKCISKLKKAIKQFKPDIIHTHLYAIKYAILATLFKKIKIVHTVHNVAEKEANSRDRKFNKFFYKRKKAIPVALSEIVKESITEEYKIPSESIPVIFNGVDFSKCMVKQNYSLGDNFKFVNVARFSEQKNHIRLIDSFNILIKQNFKAELHLYGDGELKEKIQSRISEYNIQDKVFLHGNRNNISEILNNFDCFILSSNYEGIPMTIIEAMGAGMPIISTNVGGVPNILSDKLNSLLVNAETEALFVGMKTMYESSDEERKHFGINALNDSKKYSSEKMANEYMKVYRGVLK